MHALAGWLASSCDIQGALMQIRMWCMQYPGNALIHRPHFVREYLSTGKLKVWWLFYKDLQEVASIFLDERGHARLLTTVMAPRSQMCSWRAPLSSWAASASSQWTGAGWKRPQALALW